MKTAFLYAGQGSQVKGMGKDLYEAFPAFRKAYDEAELDFDVKTLSFEDPEGKINETRYTQPALVAFACGMTGKRNPSRLCSGTFLGRILRTGGGFRIFRKDSGGNGSFPW